jgi:hypothetical protein
MIEKFSGEYTRTPIWKKFPQKVRRQIYLVVLEYLESINNIAFDKKGVFGYIWNPKLAKLLSKRLEVKI